MAGKDTTSSRDFESMHNSMRDQVRFCSDDTGTPSLPGELVAVLFWGKLRRCGFVMPDWSRNVTGQGFFEPYRYRESGSRSRFGSMTELTLSMPVL